MRRIPLVNLGDGFAGRVVAGGDDAAFWIHGYTMDSSSWTRLWQCLPLWRNVGVDLPGHGDSLPLAPGDDLAKLARRIGAVARACGARHLVAQSLGTVLGLQVVLEDPDAFDTLTLGAPALGGGPFDADLWSRYGEVKTMHAREGLSPALRERWSAPGAALFGGLDRRPELAREIRRVVARHPWWELADDAYLRLWQTPQALKDLAEVAVPTLVLVGGQDGVAVRQCAEFFERLVPNCSRHDIEGAGHLCLLEDAASVACLIEAHWNAHAPFAAVGEA